MYILKEFQEKAVKALLQHTFEALGTAQNQQQIPILLEAPTGSGKTVMMADFLYRMRDELPLQPGLSENVAYIWFAPNTLHIQSFESLQNLYDDTAKINCIDLSNLSTNPLLNSNDLLFVNWSSVDGMTKIWRKENETNTNLETLVENTTAQGTQIILIIDEAHLSAFTGKQAIAVRKLISAKIEVMVTATPNTRPQRNVFISRKEVIDEQMIKKGVRLNIGLNPDEQNGENVHLHLLRKAMEKRKELALQYEEELGKNKLNPLLLIQLPSDNASLTDEDKNIRDIVEGILSNEYGISTNNGRLAVWLSGERDKDGLEDKNGFQDVLLFKQAIAQGWDCPRAAVLISYRTVQSPNFGVQTVGRILRMPHQKHYAHDDLNYGYVYTNIESNQINFVPTDADFFNFQLAERQEDKNWYFNKLTSSTIVNDRPSKGVLSSAFETTFFNIIEKKYNITQVPEADLFTKQEEEVIKKQTADNILAMQQAGWTFEIDEHQIHIPTDIEIDTYDVNSIVLNHNQMRDFAITNAEFGVMFDRFCYDNITRLNRSKSWKLLARTLIHFAEYYLNIFEFEARKVFLFPQNKALLIQDIALALERFETWQKEKGNDKRRVENGEWEVPEIRYYSEFFNRQEIESHALAPFFESNAASNVEKAFKDILVSNEVHLEWWYKNGDSGKENFSVPYTNLQNELRLFYVDFVVKFNNGTIGLFDTKTKRSDLEAPNKHNALLDYMDAENKINTDRKLIGGVILPEDTSGVLAFRYCSNRIQDTNDLTGWDYFNPAEIK